MPLHDFGPVQIHDCVIRDFLPPCQSHDLYRIIVISIGKQKDFKIRDCTYLYSPDFRISTLLYVSMSILRVLKSPSLPRLAAAFPSPGQSPAAVAPRLQEGRTLWVPPYIPASSREGWPARPQTAGWLLISLSLVGWRLIRRCPYPFVAAAEPAYALDPPKSSSAVVLPDRGPRRQSSVCC